MFERLIIDHIAYLSTDLGQQFVTMLDIQLLIPNQKWQSEPIKALNPISEKQTI